MKNYLIVNQSSFKVSKKKLNDLVFLLLKILKKQKKLRNNELLKCKDLTLVFVDKKQMTVINSTYRNKKRPTDVLSFAPLEPEHWGELIFCLDVIKAQAREHGLSFNAEFAYMLIHGLLHLMGYDHEKNQKEEKLMFSIQDQVFDQLTKLEDKLKWEKSYIFKN